MRHTIEPLVGREELRDENKKTLIVLIGVMLALVAISVVIVLVKHH